MDTKFKVFVIAVGVGICGGSWSSTIQQTSVFNEGGMDGGIFHSLCGDLVSEEFFKDIDAIEMTPFQASQVARDVLCAGGTSILDETNSETTMNSLKRMYDVLKGDISQIGREPTTYEKKAFLTELEIISTMYPGELCNGFSYEENRKIVIVAKKLFAEFS
jgi:hypothetical protein